MGRNISQAAGSRDQNPSILPPKGGTTHWQKTARQSPKNIPTNKIFLPKIPRLGADGFHPSNSHRPARPGSAQPFSRLIKPPIEGRKIVWVGIFPKPPAGGTRIRQSFRLKAGLRTRKSRLVSLRKIFLPTKFSYPKFRGSGPGSSTRSIPTARPGPAQLNRFPINKTADRGQEDCMGRNISQAAGRRDQNPSILPPKGGTTHSKKRARQSPKNFPTDKIFLPQIPRLGAGVFHPFNAHRPARPGPAQPFSRLIKPPVEGRKILGLSMALFF